MNLALNKQHIVQIFCGSDSSKWALPGDLMFLVLEISGLAIVGRKHLRFAIFYPRIYIREDGRRIHRKYKKRLRNHKNMMVYINKDASTP